MPLLNHLIRDALLEFSTSQSAVAATLSQGRSFEHLL